MPLVHQEPSLSLRGIRGRQLAGAHQPPLKCCPRPDCCPHPPGLLPGEELPLVHLGSQLVHLVPRRPHWAAAHLPELLVLLMMKILGQQLACHPACINEGAPRVLPRGWPLPRPIWMLMMTLGLQLSEWPPDDCLAANIHYSPEAGESLLAS